MIPARLTEVRQTQRQTQRQTGGFTDEKSDTVDDMVRQEIMKYGADAPGFDVSNFEHREWNDRFLSTIEPVQPDEEFLALLETPNDYKAHRDYADTKAFRYLLGYLQMVCYGCRLRERDCYSNGWVQIALVETAEPAGRRPKLPTWIVCAQCRRAGSYSTRHDYRIATVREIFRKTSRTR